MSRLLFANTSARVRAIVSLSLLASIALVTEAGHRWA
jgi:hypothetical protein